MNCKNCNAVMTVNVEEKQFVCPYCHNVEPFDSISKEEIQELLKEALKDANKENKKMVQNMMETHRKEVALVQTESTAKRVATYVVLTVAAMFTFVMMAFGLSTEYKALGVVSLIQFVLIIVAIFTKAIAKDEKSRRLSVASSTCSIIAALLVVVWVATMAITSGGGDEKSYMDDVYSKDYDWPSQKDGFAAAIPKIGDRPDYAYVHDRECSITLQNATQDMFNEYVEQAKKDGFTIDVTVTDNTYNAYNEDDLELDVSYLASSKIMYVKLYDAIEWSSPLVWPTQGVMKEVPKPDSDSAFIETMSNSYFKAFINDVTPDKFMEYIETCLAAGFDGRYDGGTYFYADKGDANLSIELKRNKVMEISVH